MTSAYIENNLITSTRIDSKKTNCDYLKKRIATRSCTPEPNFSNRISNKIDSPKIVQKSSFCYDSKNRRVTFPLVGEIFLGHKGFQLIKPKSPKSTCIKSIELSNIQLTVPGVVTSFIEETKKMFVKKGNYLHCLRKSLNDFKSLNIPNEEISNIKKIIPTRPFEHQKSRLFLRACKHGIINTVRNLIRESPYIVHSFDETNMTGLH